MTNTNSQKCAAAEWTPGPDRPEAFDVMVPGVAFPIGTVCYSSNVRGSGWRYYPRTQQRESRKQWPTPDAALAGRVSNYTLRGRA